MGLGKFCEIVAAFYLCEQFFHFLLCVCFSFGVEAIGFDEDMAGADFFGRAETFRGLIVSLLCVGLGDGCSAFFQHLVHELIHAQEHLHLLFEAVYGHSRTNQLFSELLSCYIVSRGYFLHLLVHFFVGYDDFFCVEFA